MKKSILPVFLISSALFFSACGETPEYNIDELYPMLENAESAYEQEVAYYSFDEEMDHGWEIYSRICKENDVPCNQKIILRGKKGTSVSGFTIDSEYDYTYIFCGLEDETKNYSIFIDNGENITAEGIISPESVFLHGRLENAEITSPEVSPQYENNIAELLINSEDITYGDYLFMGKVSAIDTIENFDIFQNQQDMQIIVDTEYDEYVITVCDEQNETMRIYVECDSDIADNLNVGDSVAFLGGIDYHSNEWGYIGTCLGCYAFN